MGLLIGTLTFGILTIMFAIEYANFLKELMINEFNKK